MPPPTNAEVIDLCLDDTPAKPPAQNRRQQLPKQSRATIGDFVVLSDDTDSATNHQDEHHAPVEERPAKRRRRSASPRQDDSLNLRFPTRTQGIDEPFRRKATGGARSLQRTVTLSLDGSDPILCSSSPLHGGFQSTAEMQKEWGAEEETTTDGFDFWSGERADETGKVASGGGYSERTLALLQELDSNTGKNPSNEGQRKATEEEKKKKNKNMKSGRDPKATVRKRDTRECIELEDGEDSWQNVSRRPGPAKKPQLTGAEKAEEKARREREKQQKLADKQAERERKLAVKEAKARERQAEVDLAHANKSKMDKKMSTPEMIVDLPESLEETPVADQARSFLRNLGVEVASHHPRRLKHVIKWRRKVTAEYSEARARWEPVAERITEEKHVMRVISARELVELIQAEQAAGHGGGDGHGDEEDEEEDDGDDRLDAHVSRLKRSFPGCRIMFLIEGLAAWMRKNKNVRNHAYRAAVMDGMPKDDGSGGGSGGSGSGGGGGGGGGSRPESSDTRATATARQERKKTEKKTEKKKKPQPQYIDEDVIEDALLRLQAMHTCLIHHTASAVETAEWIANFTQHISTIPYK
ncbi:MAG: hypothetical protein M1815_005893 [Lichina confinis]|nr:MAG: hypothetical protein M1815_005893 [Lichina confinis]